MSLNAAIGWLSFGLMLTNILIWYAVMSNSKKIRNLEHLQAGVSV